MKQFKCTGCGLLFSSEVDNNQHQSECQNYILKIEPSFKIKHSKKKRQLRASVQGSFEWALRMPLPKNSKKFLMAMDEKYSQADLEKEVLRLEREIIFGKSDSEKCLNRQIVASHLLKQKIAISVKIKMEVELQQKRDAEQKKVKGQAKRDRTQGSALGGEFDKRCGLFVSGGAPGLGKRA
ncbi:hypothetical protein [Photobacterium galatheae]|uniref:C2H2-type domain-containing protein n=1 Tax=Photobacterium galatheae TaxID=1654360 RepID=A0A066RVU2_9GAMM|nr:hypothetical protein [Photobacterium galatheae]KDM91817.1 hypothetical protein EA58_09935 [Photobacterium galatheae]MCM0147088.1 hypothetical protein [Photobacterium galatheae]